MKSPRELYHLIRPFSEYDYWVLEERELPVVCLSINAFVDDEGFPEIRQIKNRADETAFAYRADVLAFVQSPAFSLGPEGAKHGIDFARLAIDTELGRPGQPWREGEIRSRLSRRAISYQLWADETRGRYLVRLPSDGTEPFDRHLRLDLSVSSEFGRWALTGSQPPAWRGTIYELMAHILKAAWPAPARPSPIRRALQKLEEERTSVHANVYA